MADERPLSDNQAGDALHAALLALGTAPGETVRANAALTTARQALRMLQLGLLLASEKDQDEVPGIITQPPAPSLKQPSPSPSRDDV